MSAHAPKADESLQHTAPASPTSLQQVMTESVAMMETPPDSQDPLAGVPPMKKYLLEQRVSAPSTTVETPAPIEAATTTSLEEIGCELTTKRYTPTASKILGETVWLIKNVGRVGKTFTDVTIACASIWEENGKKRTFERAITVGMLNEDLMGACYMTLAFCQRVLSNMKVPSYGEWLERIRGSLSEKPKSTLMSVVVEYANKAIDQNYNGFLGGAPCAAFQRRIVRRVTDLPHGMVNNTNICLSSNTARFTYAIVRTILM